MDNSAQQNHWRKLVAEDAARYLRIPFQPVIIGNTAEIDGAFAAFAKEAWSPDR